MKNTPLEKYIKEELEIEPGPFEQKATTLPLSHADEELSIYP